MAKGNALMGTLSGKLGDLVFFRRKGEQVSRAYIKKVPNPNTRAQVRQRSSLTNIIRLYQSSPSFFERAFQNKKVGQSDYNALVSLNLRSDVRIFLPKEMADNGGGVVAPYIISSGSLQPILVSGQGVNAITNIAVGADFEVTEDTTVAQLSAAILSNNTFMNPGDQLSYLSIEQFTYMDYPRLRARKYELVIDTTDNTPVLDVMPEQAVNVSGGFLAHGDLVYSGAFAWVLSRVVNGSLHVSKQALIVTDDNLYADYVGAAAITRAETSYMATSGVFLDPNDSGEGTSAVPSVVASVAQVSLQGTRLVANGSPVTLAAAGSIAAGALVLTGSGLTSVPSVSLTAGNGTTTQTVNVPVTATGDTQLANTDAVTLTGFTRITNMQISIDGRRVFAWTSNASGDDDNPIG